ncbi:hypothetical protein GBAR_LOCUS28459 [Geodia barretti]|uniref:Uncharacterized protein n=1 Tax=Geodia barretti TaxID=519541 RepID=A0AA35TRY5_GEOBA|nr:hypothetical protein GBAR_LOCUS28459 [Geodia barretti]
MVIALYPGSFDPITVGAPRHHGPCLQNCSTNWWSAFMTRLPRASCSTPTRGWSCSSRQAPTSPTCGWSNTRA